MARQYSARWIEEEFHKALKTGLAAEALQLETAQGLFAAIAIMSVVALRLIDLRERVRIHPEAPAEEAGLDPLELQVLRARVRQPIKTDSASSARRFSPAPPATTGSTCRRSTPPTSRRVST